MIYKLNLQWKYCHRIVFHELLSSLITFFRIKIVNFSYDLVI